MDEIYIRSINWEMVKVKFTLVQATKAKRESEDVALLFL